MRSSRTKARRIGTWFEIGAAWPHKDGKGYSVKLTSIAPIVIRTIEPKGDAKGASPE